MVCVKRAWFRSFPAEFLLLIFFDGVGKLLSLISYHVSVCAHRFHIPIMFDTKIAMKECTFDWWGTDISSVVSTLEAAISLQSILCTFRCLTLGHNIVVF